jgi:dihydroorotase
LVLTDEACAGYDTNTKMAPPLRADRDVQACREALIDGTIDCIATDHAPHSSIEKDVEFEQAAFGVIGLETAIPLTIDLVTEGKMSALDWVDRFTSAPARVLGLPGGRLEVGGVADIAVINPEAPWTFTKEAVVSRSKNSPFLGQNMKGKAVLTIVGGRIVHESLS